MYTLLSIPLLVAVCFTWHWEFALIVIALTLTPLCALAWWWRPNASLCTFSHVVTAFGHGFWVLGSTATLLGLLTFFAMQIIASVFVVSFFAWLAPIWQVVLVIGASLCAFIATEEACKAVYTRRAMARQVNSRGAKPFVIASASASLGHAAALSIMLTYLVTESALGDARIDHAEFGLIAAYAFVFAAFSMPLNVLTSYLLALELAKLTPEELGVPGAGSAAPRPPPVASVGERPPPSYQRAPEADAWQPHGPLLPSAVAKVLRWPVAMRTLFTAQPFFWFSVSAPLAGGSAEAVTLALTLAGAGAVYAAVLRRVKALEGPPPPPIVALTAAGDAIPAAPRQPRVRRRFGFALLADHDDDDDDDDGREARAREGGGEGGLRTVQAADALPAAPHAPPPPAAHGAPRPARLSWPRARRSNDDGLPPPPEYGDETGGGGGVEMGRVQPAAASAASPPRAVAVAIPMAVPYAAAAAGEGAQSPLAVAQAVLLSPPPAAAAAPSAAPGVVHSEPPPGYSR